MRWIMVMNKIFLKLLLCGAACSAVFGGEARFAEFFRDNMVLQSGVKVPVWGYGEPGSKVELSLLTAIFDENGMSLLNMPPYIGKVDDSGRWQININPSAPGGQSVLMLRVDDSENSKLEHVVFGDVFLFIGGAELERRTVASADTVKLLRESRIADLRLLKIGDDWAAEPQMVLPGEWKRSDPRNAAVFSNIAYTCGVDLCRRLKYPVGIIAADFPGIPVSAWLSEESFTGTAQEYISRYKSESVELGKLKAEFGSELEVKSADEPPFSPHDPAVIFNAMIAPVAPAALKAVIWYPESVPDKWYSTPPEQVEQMIKSIRSAFKNSELPVFIILSADEALASAQRSAAEKHQNIFIVECAGSDAVGKAAADIIMEKLYNGDNEQ